MIPQRSMGAAVLGLTLALAACGAAPSTARLPVVPVPATVVHATTELSAADGTVLFGQSWRPTAGPVRAVVVLVHGLKDHSSRYAALATALVARNCAVYAFDLRGHGRSGGGRVRIERFEEYLLDLDHVLAHARKAEPGRPVFLFGHSMGGAIATLHTLTRPAEPALQGLVLSAPALKAGSDVSAFLIGTTRFLGAVLPWLPVLDLDDEAFSRDPAVVADLRGDPWVYHGKGAARTAARLLGALERIQERMAQMKAPLLVLHATEDRLTNPEGSKQLHARAASTDKTLKIYPGLYHDLLHEPEQATVLGDIVGWVAARLPGEASVAAGP